MPTFKKVVSKATLMAKNIFKDQILMDEILLNSKAKHISLSIKQQPFTVSTNMKKNSTIATKTRKKELYIEKVLDSHKYSPKKPMVFLNPYKLSPLSALVVFNTKTECRFSYTVKGQNGAADFTQESKFYTKRHRIPVVALYENTLNLIDIQLFDKDNNVIAEKTVKIQTEELPETLKSTLTYENPLDYPDNTFLLITGGFLGSSYAFDNKGNIRYISSKLPYPYGYHLLSNGHFLYAEQDQRRFNYGNAHTNIMYEMDYLGRAYMGYHNEIGFHHWAIEEEVTGNFLQSSSSFQTIQSNNEYPEDKHLENQIIEVDRKTGEVLRKINMNDYFDPKFDNRHDWAHINSFDYIYDEDAVIASLRNVHTIVKINLKKKEIEWVLNNPEFVKGSAQEDKVLKPLGHHDWFFQQHAVKILSRDKANGTIDIMLFDNHTANRRPVDWFDGEKKSNIMIYRIDEKNKTVTQVKRFPTALSITRSNAVLVNEFGEDKVNIQGNINRDDPKDVAKYAGKRRIYAMCANLETHIQGQRAEIYEYDYETGEQLNKIVCKNDFFCSYFINFNVDSMIKPIVDDEPYILGELTEPKKISKLPNKYSEAPSTKEIETLKFRVLDDMFQIHCKDHTLKKVFLYNDEHIYEMNLTDTVQDSKLFKKMSFYVSIPLDKLADGTYNIALKHRKVCYKLDYYIKKTSK